MHVEIHHGDAGHPTTCLAAEGSGIEDL